MRFAPVAVLVVFVTGCSSGSSRSSSAASTAPPTTAPPSTTSSTPWSPSYLASGVTFGQVVADPSGVVYAVTSAGIARTTDGGKTWSMPLGNPGLTSLAFDLAKPATVFVGSSPHGVVRSPDSGQSWQKPPFFGLTDPEVTSLATTTTPAPASVIVAGTANGRLFRSVDAANHWTLVADHLGGAVRSLAADRSGVVYAGIDHVGISRSADAGATWRSIGATKASVRALAIDPRSSDVVFVAGGDSPSHGYLAVSRDGGKTWAGLSLGAATPAELVTLAIAPSLPDRMYVGAEHGGVFTSGDGGATWTAASGGLTLAGTASIPQAFGLAVDPTAPLTVYAASTGGIYKTTTGGL